MATKATSAMMTSSSLKDFKVSMAHFFRRFQVSPTLVLNEMNFDFFVIAKITQGCNLSLEKRNF
jgi:hypothetical protein